MRVASRRLTIPDIYFDLRVHGRMQFYRRHQVVHPCATRSAKASTEADFRLVSSQKRLYWPFICDVMLPPKIQIKSIRFY